MTTHRTSLKKKIPALFIGLLFFIQAPNILATDNPFQPVSSHITNGGYYLQLNNKEHFSYNEKKLFVPASTIKIFTSLMALEILGPQYRYTTKFYLDEKNNLYIKGSGDPSLTSENIGQICDFLANLNIEKINTLILDDSEFNITGPPPGSKNSSNPYDAHPSGLSVNFNSISIQKLKGGKIVSGEKLTPLLPMALELGKKLPAGFHRINVNQKHSPKHISNTLRYSGELFSAFLKMKNIPIENGFKKGLVPEDGKLIYTYKSVKNVEDLVQDTLKYSNNFIANQLFLTCGIRLFGAPATWEKTEQMVKKYLDHRIPSLKSKLQIKDGSGLSRETKISPVSMIIILKKFAPYARLLTPQKSIYLKSGTLTGVYCYAGYFGNESTLSPFVLFLNQKQNTRDKIVSLLHEEFKRKIASATNRPSQIRSTEDDV